MVAQLESCTQFYSTYLPALVGSRAKYVLVSQTNGRGERVGRRYREKVAKVYKPEILEDVFLYWGLMFSN